MKYAGAGLETFGRRVECRLADASGTQTADLAGKVDFVLAFAVVHELTDPQKFFRESFIALKPGGRLLFSEPSDHIDQSEFAESLDRARKAGFAVESTPIIRACRSAVLAKRGA